MYDKLIYLELYFSQPSMIRSLRNSPATLGLIVANVLIFGLSYFYAGTFNHPRWTIALLSLGAQFNPFTLDKEWHRLVTHMFLHNDGLHLAMNMYGLFSVGISLEGLTGGRKFLMIYLLTGIAGVLCSSYFSLFTIGVGASAAIFGLFGFELVVAVHQSRKEGRSVTPLFVNFLVFLIINVLLAKSLHADNAAHFGGLIAGALLGIYAAVRNTFSKINIEYLAAAVLLIIYLLLPRFTVTYFKFFQKILVNDEKEMAQLNQSHSDAEYIEMFNQNILQWDTTSQLLSAHRYLPSELAQDTFKLKRYIRWKQKINQFRINMIERESYIFRDSIDISSDSIDIYTNLEYNLNLKVSNQEDSISKPAPPPKTMTRIWYDSNWVEIPSPPATYYRVGFKDSLGRWQGPVRDYYNNGQVQMKGNYRDSKRNGIFIYYSNHHTYQSAGQYRMDRNIGKWETFHNKGKLKSEVYYTDRYFLKSLWDSTGLQLIKEGNGDYKEYYTNGVLKEEGQYLNGYKEGYWRGRYQNDSPYFEENYFNGRLVKGRSRNTKGEIFIYDESTLYPFPICGNQRFNSYLISEAAKRSPAIKGSVRLSFRVTSGGIVTDFNVEKSLSPELDEIAEELIKKGPKWNPAKLHGQVLTDGYAFVTVVF